MLAEQIPGALFVVLVALVSWMVGEPIPILVLALGCAVGWWGMCEDDTGRRQYVLFIALAIWAIAFVYLSWKVLV